MKKLRSTTPNFTTTCHSLRLLAPVFMLALLMSHAFAGSPMATATDIPTERAKPTAPLRPRK